jgi:hypothetical protein
LQQQQQHGPPPAQAVVQGAPTHSSLVVSNSIVGQMMQPCITSHPQLAAQLGIIQAGGPAACDPGSYITQSIMAQQEVVTAISRCVIEQLLPHLQQGGLGFPQTTAAAAAAAAGVPPLSSTTGMAPQAAAGATGQARQLVLPPLGAFNNFGGVWDFYTAPLSGLDSSPQELEAAGNTSWRPGKSNRTRWSDFMQLVRVVQAAAVQLSSAQVTALVSERQAATSIDAWWAQFRRQEMFGANMATLHRAVRGKPPETVAQALLAASRGSPEQLLQLLEVARVRLKRPLSNQHLSGASSGEEGGGAQHVTHTATSHSQQLPPPSPPLHQPHGQRQEERTEAGGSSSSSGRGARGSQHLAQSTAHEAVRLPQPPPPRQRQKQHRQQRQQPRKRIRLAAPGGTASAMPTVDTQGLVLTAGGQLQPTVVSVAARRSSAHVAARRTAFNPAARGSGHALQVWGQEGGPNIGHATPPAMADDDDAAAELDVEGDVRAQKLARR